MKPIAATGSLFVHAIVVLLALSAVPETAFGAPCTDCGGFNDGPSASGWPRHAYPHDVRLTPELRCPKSARVDREPTVAAPDRLPLVVVLPVMLCARIAADGSVDAVRVLQGSVEGGQRALDTLRALRFKPATAGGKPVPFWLPLTLDGDAAPFPVD